MADTRTPEQRTRIMQAVGVRDTGPEMVVRRMLHRIGYRYRLHACELPGKVDIYFPSRRKAIFVHGCFWHGHRCRKGRLPSSRLNYWGPKIAANRLRDQRNIRALRRMGIETKVVWQCQIRDCAALQSVLVLFLGRAGKNRVKV
jgi:DNA mismatch endonuclease, patch repair protein